MIYRSRVLLQRILVLILSGLLISFAKAGYMPDRECNPSENPDLDYIDLSFNFPSTGQFDNGTAGWTVDTSGFGIVTSYAATNEGWVGLRCNGTNSAQTAAIEYGPISISTTTTGTSRPAYDWDQIACCVHFRGSPEYNNKIAGRFQIQVYDAIGSEVYTFCAVDASSSAVNNYYPAIGLDSTGYASSSTWSCYTWEFTPPHQNWYRISKFRLSYSVPSGVSTTEVQIDQVYLLTIWFKK